MGAGAMGVLDQGSANNVLIATGLWCLLTGMLGLGRTVCCEACSS